MNGLIALLGLILLGLPIAVILLWIGHSQLKTRISTLEQEVVSLRAAPRAKRAPAAAKAPMSATLSGPKPAPDSAPDPSRRAKSSPQVRPDEPSDNQNRPLVITAARGRALIRWLRDNWVYVVSSLSLALAGVFFVQYGIEKGLLPPTMRVVLAIVFGACLIVAGEWLRRKQAAGLWASTAFLPAVFAGAGLVSIFAGIVAGRQIYALYGYQLGFAGLVLTSGLAVGLGWCHGPLLATIGLLGAAAAPFLVAGPEGAAPWLYGYFALIAAGGLAVDALRRWAWVSVLALVLGYGGGFLIYADGAGNPGWTLMLAALALLATAVPVMRLVPDHPRPSVAQSLLLSEGVWPGFPVRLAAGAALISSLGLLVLDSGMAADSLWAFAALALLALVFVIWTKDAPGLSDLAILPAAGFLLRLIDEVVSYGPLAREFAGQAILLRAPESAAPWTVSGLLGLAVLITGAAAWRALEVEPRKAGSGQGGVWFGLGAALMAPVTALLLEFFWHPALVLGPYPWALHVMALAALMAGLALRFAARDGQDRRRVAHATLSALSLIALALFLIATTSALTLALAALVVVAAGLDRRFRLPEMSWFVQLGVIVLGWRLIIDPGLIWAYEAPLFHVLLAFGGAIGAALAGLWLLAGMDRGPARVMLESAAAGASALLANVLITRWLTRGADDWAASHWGVMLNTLPWLILMLVQLYRMQLPGPMRFVRGAIALVSGVLVLVGTLLAAGPSNPLLGLIGVSYNLVYGPWVLDTLALAYALPGLILLATLPRLPHLKRWLTRGMRGTAVALLALYVALEIRRFWRGDDLSVPGVTQAELYSYTLAMMTLGAALLYQAIARRSGPLRRIAMAVIGLTIAKVFLIDASGLSGLMRVMSFFGLGLTLAALAWLNRWALGQQSGGKDTLRP